MSRLFSKKQAEESRWKPLALSDIDSLIRKGIPFYAYCLPDSKGILRIGVQTQGDVRLFYDIEELNGQQGFVIAPFSTGKPHPIVLIKPNKEFTAYYVPCDEPRKLDIPLLVTSPLAAYSACFTCFLEVLQQQQFDKLVLSRSMEVQVSPDFSVVDAFCMACEAYPHSYSYLCYTPYTGVWMGSTPEVLLSGKRSNWNTVALAGTQPLQEGCLPQEWDDKNRKEQEYVASYIRSQLQLLGITPKEEGPYSAYAGALSHLKTDFTFSLPDSHHLGTLLKLLHPTPAVCGLPKEKAYQFILGNERYDRRYYSGFVGSLAPDEQTDLYVSLRCFSMESDKVTLYAGGGLLASSVLEDEWMETERKMQTMLRLIEN